MTVPSNEYKIKTKISGAKIALTVDVEPLPQRMLNLFGDKDVSLKYGFSMLLNLAEKYKVRMTYFITHDYWDKIDIRFPALVEKASEVGEVGCHVHFGDGRTYRTDYDFQRALIQNATYSLRNKGFEVRSFRGGAHFFNKETLKILEELDYEVDSSIVPGLYAKPVQGLTIDHRKVISLTPYFLSEHTQKVLEVPLTVIPLFKLKDFLIARPLNFHDFLKKPSSIIIKLQKLLKKEPLIVVGFHTFDLLYFEPSEIEKFFKTIKQLNIDFLTLNEVKKNCESICERSLHAGFTFLVSRRIF